MNKTEHDALMRAREALNSAAKEIENIVMTRECVGCKERWFDGNSPAWPYLCNGCRDSGKYEVSVSCEGFLFDPKLHGVRRQGPIVDFGLSEESSREMVRELKEILK